jgi:hypothetical protein
MNLEGFGRFCLLLAAKFGGYVLGTVLNKSVLLSGQSLKQVRTEYLWTNSRPAMSPSVQV